MSFFLSYIIIIMSFFLVILSLLCLFS